jgi:hypothetical protein
MYDKPDEKNVARFDYLVPVLTAITDNNSKNTVADLGFNINLSFGLVCCKLGSSLIVQQMTIRQAQLHTFII